MAANVILRVNEELDFDQEFNWAIETAMTPPPTDVSSHSDCASVEIESGLEQTIPSKSGEVPANSAPQSKPKGNRGASQSRKRKANQDQSAQMSDGYDGTEPTPKRRRAPRKKNPTFRSQGQVMEFEPPETDLQDPAQKRSKLMDLATFHSENAKKFTQVIVESEALEDLIQRAAELTGSVTWCDGKDLTELLALWKQTLNSISSLVKG